jgi:hypothetical protein
MITSGVQGKHFIPTIEVPLCFNLELGSQVGLVKIEVGLPVLLDVGTSRNFASSQSHSYQ